MFAILLGMGAAAVLYNTNDNNHYKVRTMTEEERATMEYGINTTLNQNNDYLFWGQKHMNRLDRFTRPYSSYEEAFDLYNQRFDNKSRLVGHLFKVRNPTITVPSSNDTLTRFNLITPFVLDENYHASEPKPMRTGSSAGWF